MLLLENQANSFTNKPVLTTLYTYFISYNTIIVQVRYIIIETKQVVLIGNNRFLFPRSYSGEGLGATHLGLGPHQSTRAEKNILYMLEVSILSVVLPFSYHILELFRQCVCVFVLFFLFHVFLRFITHKLFSVYLFPYSFYKLYIIIQSIVYIYEFVQKHECYFLYNFYAKQYFISLLFIRYILYK